MSGAADPQPSHAETYRRVADGFSARVDAIDSRTAGWDSPTPCDGWVSRDVVVHLVEWVPAFLDAAGGPHLTIEPDPTADPAAAWHALDDQLQAVLDDPELAASTIAHPQAGEHRLDDAVAMFFMGDVLLHTWDVARATGQDEALDPVVVTQMLAGMEPIADHLEASGQYGPRVHVPDGASEQVRLLAVSGRQA